MKKESVSDDPYDILGVATDATPDEIRAAHRRLVRKFHPDANRSDPAAAKRFDAVQQAYRLLNDRDRRRRWDGQRARANRAAAHSDSGNRTPPSPDPSPPAAMAGAEDASPRHTQAPRGSSHGDRANAARFNATSRADADDVDIDLPIDESWSTAAPPPVRTASAWRKTFSPERWVPRSARATLVLVVIGGGLAGITMMAMQVMPMVGAIVLVAAPVSFYVVERTGALD